VRVLRTINRCAQNKCTPYDSQTNNESTNVQIDHLVYDFYGLTEEEIKIVEGEGEG
jgi:hypothetical protein